MMKSATDIFKRAVLSIVEPTLEAADKIRQRERRQSFGTDHPDKIFYIVRHEALNCGLTVLLDEFAIQIKRACDNGWIPVVDMKNYKSIYKDSQSADTNVWENYFEQISPYTLETVYQSKNVILAPGRRDLLAKLCPEECSVSKEDYCNYWKAYYNRFFIFNQKTKEHLRIVQENIFRGCKRVIGVHFRGTDYTGTKPKGHAIQPTSREVIDKVEEYISGFDYDHVYIASEDRTIVGKFKEHFRERCLTTDYARFDGETDTWICNIADERADGPYLNGLEYITDIYLLSQCQALVGGWCGGTRWAMTVSDTLERTYIFDLGIYQ